MASLPPTGTPMRPSRNRPTWFRAVRAIIRFVFAVGLVIFTVLDELFSPLVRPVIVWLSRLTLFQLIGTTIGRLPPYVVLVLLAVPFIAIEPLKVFGLYWTAVGHVWEGPIILIIAQILSLLVLDRIYHAGRGQLMQIGWFKATMGWIVRLRDIALTWVKATAVWKVSARIARNIRRRIVILLRPSET